MALNRLKQVLIREEVTPGVTVSPLSATYGKFYAIEPTCSREVSRYERNFARDSVTMPHALLGTRRARLSFSLEMCGQAATTPDVPAWDLAMRACGMRSAATSYITTTAAGIAGSTGPLRHGETITQATTSATAIVLHDTYPSGAITTVYVYNVVGSPNNSAVWTGGTSGATFTPSVVPTDAGQSWWPISKHTSKLTYTTLTGSLPAGSVIKGNTSGAKAIVTSIDTTNKIIYFRYYSGTFTSTETVSLVSDPSNHNATNAASIGQDDAPAVSCAIIEDGKVDVIYGARGNWRVNAKIGEPAVMSFELLGVLQSALTAADQALIASIAYDSKIPPVFMGSTFRLGHEGDTTISADYTPRITSIGIDMGNELYLRESAAASDGYEDCVITGRNVSGSFDPELDLDASYPFFADFQGTNTTNVPIGRCNFTVGSAAGNKFYVSMPGMQYDPPQTQSRNGVLAYQIPFKATGGYLSTEVAQTIGADNEFCVTYLLV